MPKKISNDHDAFEQPDWLDGMTHSNPHIRSKAFEGFMNACQQPIYFYMRKLLVNHQDADDASQEVMIQVLKSIDTFQKKATFSTRFQGIGGYFRKLLAWRGVHHIQTLMVGPSV